MVELAEQTPAVEVVLLDTQELQVFKHRIKVVMEVQE